MLVQGAVWRCQCGCRWKLGESLLNSCSWYRLRWFAKSMKKCSLTRKPTWRPLRKREISWVKVWLSYAWALVLREYKRPRVGGVVPLRPRSLDGASARLQLLGLCCHFISSYQRQIRLPTSTEQTLWRSACKNFPPSSLWSIERTCCQRSSGGPLRKSDLIDISKRAFDDAAFDRETRACGGWRSAFKSMQLLAIDREPTAGFANPLRKSHVHACPDIKMWTEGDTIIVCGARWPMAWRGNNLPYLRRLERFLVLFTGSSTRAKGEYFHWNISKLNFLAFGCFSHQMAQTQR